MYIEYDNYNLINITYTLFFNNKISCIINKNCYLYPFL